MRPYGKELLILGEKKKTDQTENQTKRGLPIMKAINRLSASFPPRFEPIIARCYLF